MFARTPIKVCLPTDALAVLSGRVPQSVKLQTATYAADKVGAGVFSVPKWSLVNLTLSRRECTMHFQMEIMMPFSP